MMRYVVSERETFDEVALNVYGDEKFAALLLEANPEQCHKIHLSGGEVLNVPELDATALSSLPAWKRGV